MAERAMHTTRPFMSGRSQAIRIPLDYRFEDTDLVINRIGDSLIITPKSSLRKAFFSGIAMLPDDFLADDFLERAWQTAEDTGADFVIGGITIIRQPEVFMVASRTGPPQYEIFNPETSYQLLQKLTLS